MKKALLVSAVVVLLHAAEITQATTTGSRMEPHPAPYNGTWVVDRKGCQIDWPATLDPNVTILWTGECQNKKAAGDGVVEIYREGRKVYFWEYLSANGLTLRNGHIHLTVDRKLIQMKMISCGKDFLKKYDERSAEALVPAAWEIGNVIVSDFVFTELNKFANQSCPIRKFSKGRKNTNLSVTTVNKGKREALAYCGYGGNPQKALRCERGWTQNVSGERLVRRVKQKIRDENAQTAERARHEELAKQRAAEAAREASRDAKAQALANRFQPTTWIPWQQVRSNPFAYEGKTFLVNTKFTKMLTRDTALFGGGPFFGAPVVFVDVPKTAFVGPKEVVIVGKVLDSDPSKNPPGVSGTVLRLKYLAHEFCTEANCSDFGKVVSR